MIFLATAQSNSYWFILPMVIAISLVYSASRHESWPRIWKHAIKLCTWIIGLLILATMVFLLINTQV